MFGWIELQLGAVPSTGLHLQPRGTPRGSALSPPSGAGGREERGDGEPKGGMRERAVEASSVSKLNVFKLEKIITYLNGHRCTV